MNQLLVLCIGLAIIIMMPWQDSEAKDKEDAESARRKEEIRILEVQVEEMCGRIVKLSNDYCASNYEAQDAIDRARLTSEAARGHP
jgi:hypothetical protein